MIHDSTTRRSKPATNQNWEPTSNTTTRTNRPSFRPYRSACNRSRSSSTPSRREACNATGYTIQDRCVPTGATAVLRITQSLSQWKTTTKTAAPLLRASETCGAERSSDCASASECLDHKSRICAFDGDILTVECRDFFPWCQVYFPYSRCGSSGGASDDLASEAFSGARDSWTTTVSLVLTLAFTWYQAAA